MDRLSLGRFAMGRFAIGSSRHQSPRPNELPAHYKSSSNNSTNQLSTKLPHVPGATGTKKEDRPSNRWSSGSNLSRDGDGTSINVDNFSMLGVLGVGSSGKVLLVRSKLNNELYAMKTQEKRAILKRGQAKIEQVIQEKKVMQEMKHPFIVELHYAFQDATLLYIVTDFLGGGDLFSLLESQHNLPEEWARLYAAEAILAISHIHKCGIIHRDLKPENIMLDMDGHLKLIDFGLAKTGKANIMSTTFCGTPQYIAPEVLNRLAYGPGVDWWGVGCLLYEMLVGNSPFENEDMSQLMEDIRLGAPNFPAWVSDSAQSCISCFLKKDPSLRLGGTGIRGDVWLGDVQSHPFFHSVDWEQLLAKEIEAPWKPKTGGVEQRGAPGNKIRADTDNMIQGFTEFTQTSSPSFTTASLGRMSEDGSSSTSNDGNSGSTPATKHSVKALAMELTSDGCLWSLSPALARRLGLSLRMAHLIGLSLIDSNNSFIAAEDRASFREAMEQCVEIEGGGEAVTVRCPVEGQSGEMQEVWLDCTMDMYIPGDRPVKGVNIFDQPLVIVSILDVTADNFNKCLVKKRYEISYNLTELDPTQLLTVVSKDLTWAGGTQAPLTKVSQTMGGFSKYVERAKLFRRAFPDIQFLVGKQNCQGDTVTTEFTWQGTHLGPYHIRDYDGQYMDLDSTGKAVRVTGVALDVIRNGMIIEHSAFYDEASLRQQILHKGDNPIRMNSSSRSPPSSFKRTTSGLSVLAQCRAALDEAGGEDVDIDSILDSTVIRFLLANNNDISSSAMQVVSHQQWIGEWIDLWGQGLTADPPETPLLGEEVMSKGGYDTAGRPLIILKMGRVASALQREVSDEEVAQWTRLCIWHMESALTRASPAMNKVVVVLDCKDVDSAPSTRLLDRSAASLQEFPPTEKSNLKANVLSLSAVLDTHYPGVIHKCIVINWEKQVMMPLWMLVRDLFGEKLRDSVEFVGGFMNHGKRCTADELELQFYRCLDSNCWARTSFTKAEPSQSKPQPAVTSQKKVPKNRTNNQSPHSLKGSKKLTFQ